MGDELAVFRGVPFQVSPGITVRQPTLEEICAYGEEKYFSLVRALCATPADRKVEIWDAMHVYWEKVNEGNHPFSFSALKDYCSEDEQLCYILYDKQ